MNNKLLTGIVGKIKDYSPEILISAGVVGMTTSTVLAVRATPRALQLIKEKEQELETTMLTPKETIQAAWKPYIPAIGVGLVSASCIILGTSQNIKRNAALATVYAVSENTLKEYQRRTRAIAGEEKAREIETAVAKARIADAKPVIVDYDNSEYITNTGDGDTLIFDSFSGRYFRSSMNALDRAMNSINKSLLNEHYMTMNDFYNEINIPTIEAGSLIGWSAEVELMDIGYDSDVDKNGQPYLILTHYNRPRPIRNRY